MKPEDYNKLRAEDRTSYWIGRLLISIGAGTLRAEVYLMIDYLTRDAYERGVSSAKEQENEHRV
jgi:hypothetical protein